jgi:1,4-alpha-glucan branching enzyme
MTKTGQSRKRAALNGDQIAHRAFQLWNAAKRPAGRQSEFWRQAETEFLSARKITLKTEPAKNGTQTFSFAAPFPMSVQLVGASPAGRQKPIKMQKGADRIWRASLELPPGEHHYNFLVWPLP